MASNRSEPFTVVVAETAERPPARRWVRAGVFALLLFGGGLFAWGGLAPIESAAIAVGTVSVDSNKKSVQHLEGGIVAKILVRDGQEVAAGQVLLQLDTTQTAGKAELHRNRLRSLEAQLRTVEDERKTVEELLKKGQSTRPRLLALERKKAELEGEIADNKTQLKVAEDAIARAEVKAPIAGTVVDLKVHTTGGVIKAGDTLMMIVPKDDPLVIESQIDPNDIDVVRIGLPAHVRLTPYNMRYVPPLKGKVVSVSADRFTDPNSKASYYTARVVLNEKPQSLDPSIKLYQGMPAEVIIVTGERTLLAYLAAPILRSFRRAFRED
jgi:multidrug efflux pump subunit AcrA (membrane-fusion protein)